MLQFCRKNNIVPLLIFFDPLAQRSEATGPWVSGRPFGWEQFKRKSSWENSKVVVIGTNGTILPGEYCTKLQFSLLGEYFQSVGSEVNYTIHMGLNLTLEKSTNVQNKYKHREESKSCPKGLLEGARIQQLAATDALNTHINKPYQFKSVYLFFAK